ncbi:hypothetical protein B1B04_15395 [Lysinibacillus sp. KCTC 33748]|uniref:hypothetical protein n=1 Tax=unclassified Lysinibacillus TaxID=2636778 RepID=UPI0009A7D467|nr:MULTISPECIES: hypothetical protein [unclassified Lysinibacillus]OXS72681.1 hypothetical protein B1B04_15395 [Lysinibacillus sp. KCTC 33748]SKB92598.1 hypothetical protein SAMN06295926_112115 [Lysinibacillus sp. AC-3]
MRIYKLVILCTSIILLTGCNTFSSKTEVPSKNATSEAVKNEPVVSDSTTHKEKEDEPVVVDITNKETDDISTGSSRAIVINEEVASPLGESKSYFTYEWDFPFKISATNTGTKRFYYKIQNVDKEAIIANGILNGNESFEKLFKGFPKGAYVITYRVTEEEPPVDIKLKVKVEVLS